MVSTSGTHITFTVCHTHVHVHAFTYLHVVYISSQNLSKPGFSVESSPSDLTSVLYTQILVWTVPI